MALDAFVAGRYTSTYNALDMGATTNGIILQQEIFNEDISPSDAYGRSAVDFVTQGVNWSIILESKTAKAGPISAFYPYATALGILQTTGTIAAPIGRLGSAIAQQLVMTAVSGTAFNTSGANVINTLTATLSVAAEGTSQLLFHSRLRTVPIRLKLLISEATGSGTTTARAFTVA